MHTENASSEPMIKREIPGGEPTGKKVLIIDDDPTISALMQRQLVKNGYAVLIARSGKEGLSLAKTHQPDVITLDILMPEIDGWSTLRALKADPESRQTRHIRQQPLALYLRGRRGNVWCRFALHDHRTLEVWRGNPKVTKSAFFTYGRRNALFQEAL